MEVSISGHAAAASITHYGSFDGIDDITYFDSTLGTLDSVTVEHLFGVITEYSMDCNSQSGDPECTAAIYIELSHGITSDDVQDALYLNDYQYYAAETLANNVLFSGSEGGTFSNQSTYTGAGVTTFIDIGLLGYDPWTDDRCSVSSPETLSVACQTLPTNLTNGYYSVTYDWTETSAVPVPAAIWLFGTALVGLVGFGKRRKTA